MLRPLKVTLTNWPEGRTEDIVLENHPAHPEMGVHTAPFGRTLYIEQDDFMLNPPKKFFRLFPGGEVRLKGAYIIRCDECVQDEDGRVVELRCSVDMQSRSGSEGGRPQGQGNAALGQRRVRRSLYGAPVRAASAGRRRARGGGSGRPQGLYRPPEPRLAERAGGLHGRAVAGGSRIGDRFQFLRMGYFCKDPDDTVFNRIVELKDSFKKAIGK